MSNYTIRAVIITCFIIIALGLIGLAILSVVNASGISDEAKGLVDDLRWKHYGCSSLICTKGDIIYYDPIEYTYLSISFEDGVLYVETNNGTWFIEMQRKEE